MARSPAQRQRQQEAGVTKIELLLDNQELAMLKRNCALRRPGREPYDAVEYLTLLICKDAAELQQKLEALRSGVANAVMRFRWRNAAFSVIPLVG